MRRQMRIVLANNLAELERAAAAVAGFLDASGISPKNSYAVNLAVEEVVTNIIKYGYEDQAEHKIELSLDLESDQIRLLVADDGRPFDPLSVPDPDLEVSVEDRPVGGLGIYLTRKMSDSVQYARRDDRNWLEITIRCSERSEG